MNKKINEINFKIEELTNLKQLNEQEKFQLNMLIESENLLTKQIEELEYKLNNLINNNEYKNNKEKINNDIHILLNKKKDIDKKIKIFTDKVSIDKETKLKIEKLNNLKQKLINKQINSVDLSKLSKTDRVKFSILNDFKIFLTLAFKELMNVKPTKLQYEIADYLQSENNYRMIKAYRGVGKTYITAAYISWRLLRDNNYTVLVVSASQEYAVEVGRWIREIIGSLPFTQHLIPSKLELDNAKQFTVPGRTIKNKVPSVKMGSIIGGITGSRAFEILADDVETSNNSETQLKRDNLKSKIKELESILMPGGRITYLGTPQSQESLYNDLDGYSIRVWTALYPDKKQIIKYNNTLAPSITEKIENDETCIGTSTNPEMHSTKDLIGREARVGKSYFQLQFMLDTSLSDSLRYPLKTSDFIIYNCNKDKAPLTMNWGNNDNLSIDLKNRGLEGDKYYQPFFVDDIFEEYEMSIMTIDPSGKGSDETAYTIAKYLNGFIYILEIGSTPGGYSPEILIKLAKIAKYYKVNKIITEENYGGGMFNQLLQGVINKIHPCEIVDEWTNKQKELRIIDTLEPAMNSHKIIINQSVIEIDNQIENKDYSFIHQLTRIEKKKDCLIHDDKLDSMSAAIGYFVENMSIDEIEFVNQYKQDLAEQKWLEMIGDDDNDEFDKYNCYHSIR
jgi:hypothetical protein